MPTVSLLLNVRNGMPYLRDTLASIAAQTFTDYEVLVWLMQSDDGTEEELSRWIPERLPGRVFKSGLMPLGEARGELVKRAESEFCACCDADDLNEADRLAKQVSFLRDHPEVALVGSRLRIIDEQSKETGEIFDYPLTHEEIVLGFLGGNTIGQPSVLYRRAAVLAAGNYSSQSFSGLEDYDLWLRLAVNHRLANLPECLIKYRVHTSSITRRLIAKGVHEEQSNETFARNAPSLFGIDYAAAKQLCHGHDPFTFARAVKIARHRSRTQGGTVWETMRNASFIRFMRSKTRSRDLMSRFALAVLDRNSNSVWRELARLLVQILNQLPFGARLVKALRARRVRRKFESWRHQQNSSGRWVDHRVEFIGRPDGPAYVCFEPGVCLERDITIWISPDAGGRPELRLGEKVYVGRNTFLGVYKPMHIGNRVLIGAYCYLVSSNHNIERRDIPINDQGSVGAPIIIEDDAWLGTHVVVLPGVTIGKGAVIGAGSVVTCDVPAWEIWGGVPARFIKHRPG